MASCADWILFDEVVLVLSHVVRTAISGKDASIHNGLSLRIPDSNADRALESCPAVG